MREHSTNSTGIHVDVSEDFGRSLFCWPVPTRAAYPMSRRKIPTRKNTSICKGRSRREVRLKFPLLSVFRACDGPSLPPPRLLGRIEEDCLLSKGPPGYTYQLATDHPRSFWQNVEVIWPKLGLGEVVTDRWFCEEKVFCLASIRSRYGHENG